MRLRRLILTILFVVMFSLSAGIARAQTVTDISKQLICQCGCTSVLDNCTHAECGVREQMLALIKDKQAQGQSPDEIIQFFVARYGEKVLASPPKRGFNLTAWILPFAAILVGAGVVYVLIRRWVRLGRVSPSVTKVEIGEADKPYEQRLEEELKQFTMRGFR